MARRAAEADDASYRLFTETIGREIKKRRVAKGLTQEELAFLIGGAGISIYHFESGNRKPSLVTLRRIADALEVRMTDILEPLNEISIPYLPEVPDSVEPPARRRAWKIPGTPVARKKASKKASEKP